LWICSFTYFAKTRISHIFLHMMAFSESHMRKLCHICRTCENSHKCRIFTSAKEVMFLSDFVCLSVCLSVCEQDNSKSYGRIFLKFWGNVGHGISYKWFNFGRDPAGILDSGSLWNFHYHCVKGGIREPLAERRWWRHLANSFALAEVPAGYDCFSSSAYAIAFFLSDVVLRLLNILVANDYGICN